MPDASWESLIAGLCRSACEGDERTPAVDKLLLALMILARAQRGGPANVFRFRDLDAPLGEALAAFGPAGAGHTPEAAFWRLQEDGFWFVHDLATLVGAANGSGSPPRARLLEADAAAEVPAPLWDDLRNDPARVARLLHTVLAAHWPQERHGEILAKLVFDLQVDEEEEEDDEAG